MLLYIRRSLRILISSNLGLQIPAEHSQSSPAKALFLPWQIDFASFDELIDVRAVCHLVHHPEVRVGVSDAADGVELSTKNGPNFGTSALDCGLRFAQKLIPMS
jgi:hypothetical protein